jgi:hypothetical protein
MAETLSILKTLPVNKTVVFYSAFEGEDVLVRTGVINDGSSDCFFHCIMHIMSKDYVFSSESQKKEMINKLKKNIFLRHYTELRYDELKKDFKSKIMFITENFYKFISSDSGAKGKTTKKVIKNVIGDDKNKLEYFKVIKDLIPLDNIQSKIDRTFEKYDEIKIEDYTDKIIKQILKYFLSIKEIESLDNEIKDVLQLLIEKLIYEICKEANKVVNKSFVDSIIDNIELSRENINLVCSNIKKDIYIMDSVSRLPIDLYCEDKDNKNRSIILIKVVDGDNAYYEIVGQLLNGNRVKRDFSSDDLIVSKMYDFLCESENFSQKYPELSDYVKKPEKEKSPKKSPIKSPEEYDDDEDEELESVV